MVNPPWPPDDERVTARDLPDVDDYLSREQEDQLRTTGAEVAWRWQRQHGCADFDCLRCRVGRGLALVSKGLTDGNAGADVLCGLITDLVEQGATLDPPPNPEAYQEACALLIKALDMLERTGVALAMAMGTPPTDPPTERRGPRIN